MLSSGVLFDNHHEMQLVMEENFVIKTKIEIKKNKKIIGK